MASSTSATPTTTKNKYDVFISFTGVDTRHSFTDHLFAALELKSLIVFKDDIRLQKGESIERELKESIRGSSISVVVLSPRYADSSWCLNELLEIVKCVDELGQRVLPVFYGVGVEEVVSQIGPFSEAFERHEAAFVGEIWKVDRWREALRRVAGMDGWKLGDRNESDVVTEMANVLYEMLYHEESDIIQGLVGMESRSSQLISCMRLDLTDVRIVGICGMGGIGKTTTARAVFNKVSCLFEGSCFLTDVKSEVEMNGVESLKQKLLFGVVGEKGKIWDAHRGVFVIRNMFKRKKVLVVIDNVDKLQVLRVLAGRKEWFGPGSRILVTTRDEHLLVTYGVDEIYHAQRLNENEGLKLLSLKAFKQNHPTKTHEQIAKKIVPYASGLPLALEVLGSYLYKKSIEECEKAIKALQEPLNMKESTSYVKEFKNSPQDKIFRILKLSYNDLDVTEQRMFLDISCYFTSHDVKEVSEIFESCDFYPGIGLNVLVEKCFVTIVSGKLFMHDWLRHLGRTLVFQECPDEPGKRSRLWSYNDIHHVLANCTGTEAVEVMILNSFEKKEILMGKNAFSRMTNLRILEVKDLSLCKNDEHVFISSKLRILKWEGYPLKALPQNFSPTRLFSLSLRSSHIQELSNEVTHSDSLRFIDLSNSTNLKKLQDFTGLPNLEKLILQGCSSLVSIHPSIGNLKNLNELNLKDCISLRNLPSTVTDLKTLKTLSISGCTKLNQLPENVGNLECLEELDIRGTAVRKAPGSIVQLKNLKKLSLSGAKGEHPSFWSSIINCVLPGISSRSEGFSLPSSLSGLRSLTLLDVNNCNLREGAIPSDIGCLSALQTLNLSRNNFVTLPESIVRLLNLERLELDYCELLEVLPELPLNIQYLEAHNCVSLSTVTAPTGLSHFKHQNFVFTNCFKLNDNTGHDNVAFIFLKGHLLSIGRITLQHFLTHCPKLLSSVLSSLPSLPDFQRRLQYEIQAFPQVPLEISRLVIQLSKCRIPDWFVYQTNESSVEIQLPKNWYNDPTFMGIAFCAEFEVQKVSDFEHPSTKKSHMFGVSLQHETENSRYIITGLYRTFSVDRLAASDHLWLLYMPFNEYFKNRTWSSVVATFTIQGPYFSFKKTGVRFVYLENALEFDSSVSQQGLDSHSMCFNVYRQLLIPMAMEGTGNLFSTFINFFQRNPALTRLMDQQVNAGLNSNTELHQLVAGESSSDKAVSDEGRSYVALPDHREAFPIVSVDD